MLKCKKKMKAIAITVLTTFTFSIYTPVAEAALSLDNFFSNITNLDKIKSFLATGVKVAVGAMLIKSLIKFLQPMLAPSKSQKQKAENKKMLIKYLDNWAKKGEVRAQYALACMYYNGVERKADKDYAQMWFRMAAGRGHEDAKEALKLIKEGKAIPKQNFADICYKAGRDAFEGKYDTQDGKEAARWLHVAADSGHKKAYGLLGSVYMMGLAGAKQNEPLAINLFFEGVKLHDGLAAYQLGKMFMEGRGGVKQNYSMAASLFVEASKQGVHDADDRLTEMMNDDDLLNQMMLDNEELDPSTKDDKKDDKKDKK